MRHRAIAALIFGMLSLIALLGIRADLRRGVYLLVFSAIIGLAACVIGISALRKARRTGTYRPRGAVGGIVLGALAALLSIPILATYLAFPTQVDNYVKCLSLAQTSGEQHACENQFYRSIHLSAAAPHLAARSAALAGRSAAVAATARSPHRVPDAPTGPQLLERGSWKAAPRPRIRRSIAA